MQDVTLNQLNSKFEIWIANNPKIMESFIEFSMIAKNRGHKKISAWLIVNRVRWETEIVTTGNKFKITNDFISLLSRKVMKEVPELDGFYTTKAMTRT